MTPLISLTLGLAFIAGCRGEAPESLPRGGKGWAELQNMAELSGAGLYQVSWIEPFGEDRLVAFSQHNGRFVLFDSSLKELAHAQRLGSGPGELRRPGRHWIYGDTLWVVDVALQRISAYAEDLRFLTAAPITAAPADAHLITLDGHGMRWSESTLQGVWNNRRLVLLSLRELDGSPGGSAMASESAKSRALRVLSSAPTDPCLYESLGATWRAVARQPFCTPTIWETAHDGLSFVLLRSASGKGRCQNLSLLHMTSGGDTLFRTSLAIQRVAVPLSEVKRIASAPRIGPPGAPRMEPPKLHGTQYFPAATSVLIGWDSTVWIRARTHADGEVWIALNRDGALLGKLRIEDGARLLGANENEVVVVSIGEDDSSDHLTIRGLRWNFRDQVSDEPTKPRATWSRLCE